MAQRTLLLDLDGTLWDSRPWYAEILARLSGGPAAELEDKDASGVNIRRLASDCGVTDYLFDRTASKSAASLRFYDGVLSTLDDLAESSTLMGVVTNLPGQLVRAVLHDTDITGRFKAIVTPRIGLPAKPKSHSIRRTLQETGPEAYVRTCMHVGEEERTTVDKINPYVEPTLMASDPGEHELGEREYLELSTLLFRADVSGVVNGLGHREAAAVPSSGAMPKVMDRFENLAGTRWGIGPGFAAVAGPFGVRPLRGGSDLDLASAAVDLGIPIAVASMSARYLENAIDDVYRVPDGPCMGLWRYPCRRTIC